MSSSSQKSSEANNRFAQEVEEAKCRFERCKEEGDPFPYIPPALLNSADIEDYVAATGMICPFDSEDLKPATYEVKLLGKCVYWDEDGQKRIVNITKDIQFNLKPNSIAFVTLEPIFRIPDYIALRFNLKITHIYRGLLLGTGPLVDPGFIGKLSIPLHNLTTNNYTFKGGEGLIWMEFTKLSPYKKWKRRQVSLKRKGVYREFPPQKNTLKDVEDYLYKAEPHRAIRSSIPDAIQNAEKSARESADSARDANQKIEQTKKLITIGGSLAILAVLLPLLALGFQVNSMVWEGNNLLKETSKDFGALQAQLKLLSTKTQNFSASDAIRNAQSSAQIAVERTNEANRQIYHLHQLILLSIVIGVIILLIFILVSFFILKNYKNYFKTQLDFFQKEIKDFKENIK